MRTTPLPDEIPLVLSAAVEFWPWISAVQAEAREQLGVIATAIGWATYAVRWTSDGPAAVPGVGALDLAALTGVHRYTVQRHLTALVQSGLLCQVQRPSPGIKSRYIAVLPAQQPVQPSYLESRVNRHGVS